MAQNMIYFGQCVFLKIIHILLFWVECFINGNYAKLVNSDFQIFDKLADFLYLF
jgi:hypothetical protein